MTESLADVLAAGGCTCAVTLIAAGFIKVRDGRTFARQIAAYQIVPDRAAVLLGYVLPLGEVVAGICIFVIPRVGGVAAGTLFATFALAVYINLRRGRTELVCGCFGSTGRHVISYSHVAANLMLVTVSGLIALFDARPTLASTVLGVTAALTAAVLLSVHAARAFTRDTSSRKEETPSLLPG